MHPILFKFGPITIYSYGFMVALGFVVATFLIYRRVTKFGLDTDKVIDLTIFILIAGVIGARVLYCLLNLEYYRANMLEVLNLSKGGLVWYGGFLSVLLVLIFYARKNRLNFWDITDLVAPYAALAQAFGRIGCLLNGCCYGIEAPDGCVFNITFPGDSTLRYPVQLFSSIALVIIFIILRMWQERRHFKGEIFLGYCALYSFKRFLTEFFRGDNPDVVPGLTISQVISAAVFIIALAVFTLKVTAWRKRSSNSK